MKISCCWMYAIGKYGYPPSLENTYKAINEMRELGFDYIELEGFGYENLAQVIGSVQDIKKTCDKAGVKVSNFAVLLPDIISMNKKLQDKAFEWFKRGGEAAAIIGSPNIWIDCFFPPLEIIKGSPLTSELVFGDDTYVRVPDDFSWGSFWDHFVEAVARCTEIAKANGMCLLVEPRVGEVTSNSEALLRLGEAIDDEHFGVILDCAHQHAQKELLPLSVHKLGDLVRYVHVADNNGRVNNHFEMGNGNIDWRSVFLSLKQIGFNGFYGVDLENMPGLSQKFVETKDKLECYAAEFAL